MNTKTRPAGPPSPYSLFGLDLTVAWGFLREGWQDILRHPALAGWLPSESLRLIRPDRSEVVVAAGRVLAGAKGGAQFAAVELPEDMVLRKTLRLPDLSRAGTHSAARLEAAASSPFPAQDLVWGYRAARAAQGQSVELVLSSRSAVEAFLLSLDGAFGDRPPEVYAHGLVPVFGFGEARRAARDRQKRAMLGVLLLAVVLLGATLAVTPALQLRARALDAQQQFLALREQSGPQAEQRARVLAAAEQLAELEGRIAEPAHALRALEALTDALPDDTVLNVLDISRDRVRFAGLTANAAGLMQKLGDDPRFRDVRAPAASTRAGVGQESFTIELSFPVARAAEEQE